MRDYKLYLDDILKAVKNIEKHTKGLNLSSFKKNTLIVDAVIRNLEIVGEATKKVPDKIRKMNPDVVWKKISGLRDILIHDHFGVGTSILWDVIVNKLPSLKKI